MQIRSKKKENHHRHISLSKKKYFMSPESSTEKKTASIGNSAKSGRMRNHQKRLRFDEPYDDPTLTCTQMSPLFDFNNHSSKIKAKHAEPSCIASKESLSTKPASSNIFQSYVIPEMSLANNTQNYNKSLSTFNPDFSTIKPEYSKALQSTIDRDVYQKRNVLSKETKLSLITLQNNINVVQQRLNNILNNNSMLITDNNQDNSFIYTKSVLDTSCNFRATNERSAEKLEKQCTCCNKNRNHPDNLSQRYNEQTFATINKTNYHTLETAINFPDAKYHKKFDSKYKRKLKNSNFDLNKYKRQYMTLNGSRSVSRTKEQAISLTPVALSRNQKGVYNTIQSQYTQLDFGSLINENRNRRANKLISKSSNYCLTIEKFAINIELEKKEPIAKVKSIDELEKLSIVELISKDKPVESTMKISKCEALTLAATKQANSLTKLKFGQSEDYIAQETLELNDEFDLQLDGKGGKKCYSKVPGSPFNLKAINNSNAVIIKKNNRNSNTKNKASREFNHNNSSVNLALAESSDSKEKLKSSFMKQNKTNASVKAEEITDGSQISFSPIAPIANHLKANSKPSQIAHQHNKTGTFGNDPLSPIPDLTNNISSSTQKKISIEPLEEVEDEGSLSRLASIHLNSPRLSKQNTSINNNSIARDLRASLSNNQDEEGVSKSPFQKNEAKCTTPISKSKSHQVFMSPYSMASQASSHSKIVPLLPVIQNKFNNDLNECLLNPKDNLQASNGMPVQSLLSPSVVKTNKNRKTVQITSNFLRMEYDVISKVKHYYMYDDLGNRINSQPQKLDNLFSKAFKVKISYKPILHDKSKERLDTKQQALDKLNKLICECTFDSDIEQENRKEEESSRSRSANNEFVKKSQRLSSNHKRVIHTNTKLKISNQTDNKVNDRELAEEALKEEHNRKIELVNKIKSERAKHSASKKLKKHIPENNEKLKSNTQKLATPTNAKKNHKILHLPDSASAIGSA